MTNQRGSWRSPPTPGNISVIQIPQITPDSESIYDIFINWSRYVGLHRDAFWDAKCRVTGHLPVVIGQIRPG